MAENGSVVVAGTFFGDDGTQDFAATKIDSNGTVVWIWEVNLRIH